MSVHQNAVIVGHRKTWAISVIAIIVQANPGLPNTTSQLKPVPERKMLSPVMLKSILITLVTSVAVIVALSLVAPGNKKLIDGEVTLLVLFITILVILQDIVALYR
jgi:hypothetical protein